MIAGTPSLSITFDIDCAPWQTEPFFGYPTLSGLVFWSVGDKCVISAPLDEKVPPGKRSIKTFQDWEKSLTTRFLSSIPTFTSTWPSDAVSEALSSARSMLGSSISIMYSILSVGKDIVIRFNRSYTNYCLWIQFNRAITFEIRLVIAKHQKVVMHKINTDERAARIVWQVCWMYEMTPEIRQYHESYFFRNITSG